MVNSTQKPFRIETSPSYLMISERKEKYRPLNHMLQLLRAYDCEILIASADKT